MKIKTITCHEVYNTGASLQAYALSTYLKELGHDVEIIDYKPLYLQKYSFKKINNPRFDKPILKQIYLLLKLPGRLKALKNKSKHEFDGFAEKYLTITSKTYTSIDELKENPPIADLYFAGSDQIWNTIFKNGKDPSFYLQFAPKEAIKASYAASFATEKIEDGYQEIVKKWISSLDYISVREKSGLETLEGLGIKNAQLVLDPVFLLDKNAWLNLLEKDMEKDNYILVYDFEKNPKLADLAKNIAKKKNLKVYSFLENPWCDKSFEEEGPLKFLSLIYNAEYIISNSFHATVFSLIFNKPFAVFDRDENINTRMNDLLDLVGLNKINDVIDYEQVNKKLEVAIADSKKYIKKVIEAAEKRPR